MNNRFNIVKKPKKSDDEEDVEDLMDEDDLDEEETSSNNDFLKKRMFRFMGLIIAIMVVLLIILYIASMFSHKSYTYTEIEKIMKEAAISYFKDYPEYLPVNENSIVEVDVNNLVVAGKMKDLSEYTSSDDTCTGTVQVQKMPSDYVYVPYLNCGEKYSTVELAKKILSDQEIVTTGYGLYSNKSGHVYRGENVNNYVQLGKSLWRIVKITNDNNIVLIHSDGMNFTQPWDDRYNSDIGYEAGINLYSASRVSEYLQKVYANPSAKKDEDILTDNDRAKMVSFDVCIGKRTSTSDVNDNSLECSETLKNQKMGLLTLSDYIYASRDPNCKSVTTKSCRNYNYLATKKSWWLATADSEDSHTVYYVSRNGYIKKENASNYALVRPVIYLNSNVLYDSGNGTLEKPYKIR